MLRQQLIVIHNLQKNKKPDSIFESGSILG